MHLGRRQAAGGHSKMRNGLQAAGRRQWHLWLGLTHLLVEVLLLQALPLLLPLPRLCRAVPHRAAAARHFDACPAHTCGRGEAC